MNANAKIRLHVMGGNRPQPNRRIHLEFRQGNNEPRVRVASLVSDHTGYVSFSLARTRRALPGGQGDLSAVPLSALSVRLDDDSIDATPLHLLFGLPELATAMDIGCRSAELSASPRKGYSAVGDDESEHGACSTRPNGASIEDVDTCDYEVSPASLVDNRLVRNGDDCCDRPVPATGKVSETDIWRVVVYDDPEVLAGTASTPADALINPADIPAEQTGLRWGLLERFRQTWTHLGHSLGEVVYSLALAPGESTQLAVIEWSREDLGTRDDSIASSERLEHEQRTDRSIDETTKAALREDQGGGSFQAGAAASIPIKAIQLNIGLGGGVTHSWGKRDLSGEGTQNLHQRVVQTSTNIRAQNSTVIVQGRAREDNRVAVRAVANHNHCHALTVQYFEVLRHLDLTTRFLDREPAVLVPHAVIQFNHASVLRWRHLLRPAALDAAVAEGFAALERGITGRQSPNSQRTARSPTSGGLPSGPSGAQIQLKRLRISIISSPTQSRNWELSTGAIGIKWKGMSSGFQFLKVHTSGMALPAQSFPVSAPSVVLDADLTEAGLINLTPKDLESIRLTWENSDRKAWGAWAVQRLQVDGSDGATWQTLLNKQELIYLEASPQGTASRDSVVQDDSPREDSPDPGPSVEVIDDAVAIENLVLHVANNSAHYSRAVWVGLDDASRRMLIAKNFGQSVAGGIDGPPLAISGNHVAFRWRGEMKVWFAEMFENFGKGESIAPESSIVYLPTRGLFAEAMLGHCNACERRDITRMWDWTEATVEPLPTLTGLSPGAKGSTVTPEAPQLPSSVLNIQAAPSMPDPSGISGALTGIAQSGIFRDMSGMSDVTSLLKTLSTNASLDQATRQRAAEASAKLAGAAIAGSSGIGQRRPTARETFDNLSVGKEIAKAAPQMGWSDATTKNLTRNVVASGNDLPSLLGDWSGTDPLETKEFQYAMVIAGFRDLIKFAAPASVVSAAGSRGLTVQRIQDGWGPVNLDYYSVRINKLPVNPGTGVMFTEEEFFEHVRRNFPKFLQPFPRTGQPESLAPYSTADATSWISSAPLGSAMLFTIDVPMAPSFVAALLPERALVLCTDYSPTPMKGRRYWNFSTLTGPNPAGYHPVSGTRQFGLESGSGFWEFYVRAADRMGGTLEYSQSDEVYRGQDEYWEYFRAALYKFVTDNHGEAEVRRDSFAERFEWSNVERMMSVNRTWST